MMKFVVSQRFSSFAYEDEFTKKKSEEDFSSELRWRRGRGRGGMKIFTKWLYIVMKDLKRCFCFYESLCNWKKREESLNEMCGDDGKLKSELYWRRTMDEKNIWKDFPRIIEFSLSKLHWNIERCVNAQKKTTKKASNFVHVFDSLVYMRKYLHPLFSHLFSC
jgi:hypothetical protein